MPKFTFKCENLNCYTDEVECTNTSEFTCETLDQVVENFELFLRGSGYYFDGHLDFIKSDLNVGEPETDSSDDDIFIGSVDDYPSNHAFSFDTMINTGSQSTYSIDDNAYSEHGIVFPRGDDEDIIHFRV